MGAINRSPFENKAVFKQTMPSCWSEEMAQSLLLAICEEADGQDAKGSLSVRQLHSACAKHCHRRWISLKRACGLKTLLKVMAGRYNGTLRLTKHLKISQRQASALLPDAAVHIARRSRHFVHPMSRCPLHWRFGQYSHAQPILMTYKDNAKHSRYPPNKVDEARDCCCRSDLE